MYLNITEEDTTAVVITADVYTNGEDTIEEDTSILTIDVITIEDTVIITDDIPDIYNIRTRYKVIPVMIKQFTI